MPTAGVTFWSVIGALVLVLALGAVLYLWGKLDREGAREVQAAQRPPLATTDRVDTARPTAVQRACYKYFAVAAILFLFQVTAGLLAIADYVGLWARLGLDVVLPITVTRAWHSQVSVLWIAVCWFGATLWVLPMICRPQPRGPLPWWRPHTAG